MTFSTDGTRVFSISTDGQRVVSIGTLRDRGVCRGGGVWVRRVAARRCRGRCVDVDAGGLSVLLLILLRMLLLLLMMMLLLLLLLLQANEREISC